jgi:hypothetical protein
MKDNRPTLHTGVHNPPHSFPLPLTPFPLPASPCLYPYPNRPAPVYVDVYDPAPVYVDVYDPAPVSPAQSRAGPPAP